MVIVRHVIALKAREVLPPLSGTEDIAAHFVREYGMSNVVCSYSDRILKLRCEASDRCDLMRLREDLATFLQEGNRGAYVALVSIVQKVARKGNGTANS